MTDSIFITQSEFGNNINNKITYTDVLGTIPNDSNDSPLDNWKNNYRIEWRWRFMKFNNNRTTVEISYIMRNNPSRFYFNKYGDWVNRYVPEIYNEYVTEEHYYYTN